MNASLSKGMSQYPPVVQAYWETRPNYLIEYDQTCGSQAYCAIYFCSNDIWYPHTEEIFRRRIGLTRKEDKRKA